MIPQAADRAARASVLPGRLCGADGAGGDDLRAPDRLAATVAADVHTCALATWPVLVRAAAWRKSELGRCRGRRRTLRIVARGSDPADSLDGLRQRKLSQRVWRWRMGFGRA